MSGRIAIDEDLISAHASRVLTVADDIALAADAAASTDMGGGAFGVLCGFLVPPVGVAAAVAREAIRGAEGMLERSAAELRAVAADLTAFDDESVGALVALDRELG